MEEEENFLKVFKLVTGPGTECVRHIFDTLLPPATLNATLISHKYTTLQELKRKRRITPAQDALLFPSMGVRASSVTFDLSLMICLIRNLTSIVPPINGWDTQPPTSETNVAADIARIKLVRNLLAHTDRNVMTSSDFNIHWTNLYDAIQRQGQSDLKRKCDTIKHLKLFSDIDIQDFNCQVEDFKREIVQEINEFREEITEMNEIVSDLQTSVMAIENSVSDPHTGVMAIYNTVSDLQTGVMAIDNHVSDLQIDLTDVHNYVSDLQTDFEEVNKNVIGLHTDMKELKKQDSKQSIIPTHIQEQFRRRIDVWRKADAKFVDTAGSKQVMKCLKDNGCVSVIGNSGTGKTFTARHIALEMEKNGYLIIPLSELKDLDFFEHDHKTLFVIDDLCGKFTLNERYLDDWKLVLEKIESFLKDKCCKLIATCRLQVFQDRKFNLSVFRQCTCNLSSPAYTLTSDEIKGFFDSYLPGKCDEVPELNKDIDFYPLLFSLYNETKNIKTFFGKPFDCYTQELDTLEEADPRGRRKYCGLVLCVMFNNTLTESDLLGETSHRKTAVDKVLLNCGAEHEARKQICKDLEALQDIYVKIEDGTFKIIHDKLFDFLSMYFGNKMTEIFIKHAECHFILERVLFDFFQTMPAEVGDFIRLNDTDQPIYIDFVHVKKEIQLQVEGEVICCLPLINNGVHLISRVKIYQEEEELKYFLEGKGIDFIKLCQKHVPLYFDRLIEIWEEGEVERVFFSINFNSTMFRDSFINHLNGKLKDNLEKLVVKQDNKSLTTALHCLSGLGHFKGVEWLMSFSSVNINQAEENGLTPLHFLCLKYLFLEETFKVSNVYNEILNWFKCCSAEHIEVVKLFLKHNSIRDNPDKNGNTALHTVCGINYTEIIQTLLKGDQIDVNVQNNEGESPLYKACSVGNTNVVRILLQHPVKINNQTNNGWTPLHTASYGNHVEVVQELLKSDHIAVDFSDNEGRNALQLACDKGSVVVVRLLLQQSVNINKPDKNGWTPLHKACNNNHIEVVKELLKSDQIDVDVCDNVGNTSLCFACLNGCVDVSRLLLQNSAKINKPNKIGGTPLHAACYNNHVEVVKELLKSDKIDVDVCINKKGTILLCLTPLHVACLNKHEDVVKELLKSERIDVDFSSKNGQTSLYWACYGGNADVVRLLLQHSVNINKPDKNGWTPLHIACSNNHVEVVKELLKSDQIDVDVCDNVGNTSLYFACLNGCVDVSRLLLQNSAKINKPNKIGGTPLHAACYDNHVEVVKELLKSDKIDVDVCINKEGTISLCLTPLHVACLNNHEDVVKELLKSERIDVDFSTKNGQTSLYLACYAGNADVVRLLLQNSVNINKPDKDGMTPLHTACSNNHVDVVKELLKSEQIDVDICTTKGTTALYLACINGNADLIRLLLQNSANINKPDADSGTPLHAACYNNHIQVVRELLKSDKIDVDACTNKGQVSLYWACHGGNADVVKLLLQNSANINKPDKNGVTPLHIACYNNHVGVVTELLKSDRIDVDACTNEEGMTSLYIACINGNVEIVRILLQNSANIYKPDNNSLTPLHIACCSNNFNVVKELLKSEQIDVDVCDNMGRTSLYWASSEGNADVVRFMLQKSANVNTPGIDRCTPLHIACLKNHIKVVQALLESEKIDVDVDNNEGATSLNVVCHKGNVDMVRLLLQHSANINKSDKYGVTPLHQACYKNHVEVAKELLKSDKIKINVCDIEGKTAFYYANQIGNADVVRLLQNYAKMNQPLYLRICGRLFLWGLWGMLFACFGFWVIGFFSMRLKEANVYQRDTSHAPEFRILDRIFLVICCFFIVVCVCLFGFFYARKKDKF